MINKIYELTLSVSPLYLVYFISPPFDNIFPLLIHNPPEPLTYTGVECILSKLTLSIVIPLQEDTKNTPFPQASP